MIKYLDQTKHCLILQASNDTVVRWFVDATFVVHPDQKRYYMTLGIGAVISARM